MSSLLLISLGTSVWLAHAYIRSAKKQKKPIPLTANAASHPLTPTPTINPSPTALPTAQVTAHPMPTAAPTLIAMVVANPSSDSIWNKLATCESGGNWGDDTGNGYYGGLQFSIGAWQSVGGVGKPSDASPDEQIMRGKMLQSARGWSPWGACSRALGIE